MSLVAALLAIGLAPGSKAAYDVQVVFDGWLPLLGGRQGKAEVSMTLVVVGAVPKAIAGAKPADRAATSVIREFTAILNGAPLPLTTGSIQAFFPKSTVQFDQFGRTLSTDAPKLRLPARLPGLDSQRLPDLSFLPIELPRLEPQVGTEYTFNKPFQDASVRYDVRVAEIHADRIVFEIRLSQETEFAVDEFGNFTEVDSEKKGTATNKLLGTGKAEFDPKRGLFTSADVKAESVETVRLPKSEPRIRALQTWLKIQLNRDPIELLCAKL